MARLKDRTKQIPNGLRFNCRPLNYQASPWSSFDRIVNDLLRQTRSNPVIVQKYGLPTSRLDIENWVDAYNSNICEQNGWLDYLAGGPDHVDPGPPPKWMPAATLQKFGGRLAAGAKTLLSWLGDGAEPVEKELSYARAAICASCPLNKKVSFNDFFVAGAAELIRRQVEFSKDCGLSTPYDEHLGICDACACPIKLMVHVPLVTKLAHMNQDSFNALVPHCWVRKEKADIDAAAGRQVVQDGQSVPIGTITTQ